MNDDFDLTRALGKIRTQREEIKLLENIRDTQIKQIEKMKGHINNLEFKIFARGLNG